MANGLGWAVGLTIGGLLIGGSIVDGKLKEHDEQISNLKEVGKLQVENVKDMAETLKLQHEDIQRIKNNYRR